MQSKKRSLVEACTNIVVGFTLSVIANYYVLTWYAMPVTWGNMSILAAVMTFMSLVRSYWLRRLYNWYDVKYPTAHFAAGGDIGTITHGFLSSKDGSFVIDFANNTIEIVGGPELPPDHPDDPCDDWGCDLWDCMDWGEDHGHEM